MSGILSSIKKLFAALVAAGIGIALAFFAQGDSARIRHARESALVSEPSEQTGKLNCLDGNGRFGYLPVPDQREDNARTRLAALLLGRGRAPADEVDAVAHHHRGVQTGTRKGIVPSSVADASSTADGYLDFWSGRLKPVAPSPRPGETTFARGSEGSASGSASPDPAGSDSALGGLDLFGDGEVAANNQKWKKEIEIPEVEGPAYQDEEMPEWDDTIELSQTEPKDPRALAEAVESLAQTAPEASAAPPDRPDPIDREAETTDVASSPPEETVPKETPSETDPSSLAESEPKEPDDLLTEPNLLSENDSSAAAAGEGLSSPEGESTTVAKAENTADVPPAVPEPVSGSVSRPAAGEVAAIDSGASPASGTFPQNVGSTGDPVRPADLRVESSYLESDHAVPAAHDDLASAPVPPGGDYSSAQALSGAQSPIPLVSDPPAEKPDDLVAQGSSEAPKRSVPSPYSSSPLGTLVPVQQTSEGRRFSAGYSPQGEIGRVIPAPADGSNTIAPPKPLATYTFDSDETLDSMIERLELPEAQRALFRSLNQSKVRSDGVIPAGTGVWVPGRDIPELATGG